MTNQPVRLERKEEKETNPMQNETQINALEAVPSKMYGIKKADANPSGNIVSCPKCQRTFISLNRLSLHIDSGHQNVNVKVRCNIQAKTEFNDKFTSQVRCPQCMKVLYGSGYEHHCLKYHENILSLPYYKLAPLRLDNHYQGD